MNARGPTFIRQYTFYKASSFILTLKRLNNLKLIFKVKRLYMNYYLVDNFNIFIYAKFYKYWN